MKSHIHSCNPRRNSVISLFLINHLSVNSQNIVQWNIISFGHFKIYITIDQQIRLSNEGIRITLKTGRTISINRTTRIRTVSWRGTMQRIVFLLLEIVRPVFELLKKALCSRGAAIMGATMLPETVRYGVPFGTGNWWL